MQAQRREEGDTAYLDAAGEGGAAHPARDLRRRAAWCAGEPFQLGDHVIPPGTEINPSISGIHRRAGPLPRGRELRPERFLDDDSPDTYTWLPFGGGTRRCLGASFAMMEMRVVIQRVLERTELAPGVEQARARHAPRHHLRAQARGPRDLGLMAIEIADATEEHLPAIAAIYAEAAENTHATFDFEGHSVEWWAKVPEREELLVAVEDGEVLGFAKTRPVQGEARVQHAPARLPPTCTPDHRGKGVGNALYTELLRRLEALATTC